MNGLDFAVFAKKIGVPVRGLARVRRGRGPTTSSDRRPNELNAHPWHTEQTGNFIKSSLL